MNNNKIFNNSTLPVPVLSPAFVTGLADGEGSLNPYYITGFSDAEASFNISIYRKKECKTGWNIALFFQIGLHIKDLPLLQKIKSYFGVGHIRQDTSRGVATFAVTSRQDLLEVVIPHFEKY